MNKSIVYQEVTDLVTTQELHVDHIYYKTIRSVVWIVADQGGRQGSGVLIDTALRMVATNHHVTKNNESVWVFFPVRDLHGDLIEDRDFYLNENNLGFLKRLGYATLGRIIAEDPNTDLAIVQLDGLPETAREIKYNFGYPAYRSLNRNDPVQIFGNPKDLKLWRWTAGFFQKVDERGMLHINAGVYGGNSGGPVLNDQGVLIGIATLSNELTNTWAVPANCINDLLKTLAPIQIFSIQNNTAFTVHYQIKWAEGDIWTLTALKPGITMYHWNSGPKQNIPQGYPQICFDYIANDEKFTPLVLELQTYTRIFGTDFKEYISYEDARRYHFGYNSQTQILSLYDSEKW